MPITDLSKPTDSVNVVDLSRPAPTTAERIIKTVGVVALAAGVIAAGCGAAKAHFDGANRGKKEI